MISEAPFIIKLGIVLAVYYAFLKVIQKKKDINATRKECD
jgi:hypothetical protein